SRKKHGRPAAIAPCGAGDARGVPITGAPLRARTGGEPSTTGRLPYARPDMRIVPTSGEDAPPRGRFPLGRLALTWPPLPQSPDRRSTHEDLPAFHRRRVCRP